MRHYQRGYPAQSRRPRPRRKPVGRYDGYEPSLYEDEPHPMQQLRGRIMPDGRIRTPYYRPMRRRPSYRGRRRMRNYGYAVVLFLFVLLVLLCMMWNSIIPPHVQPQNNSTCSTIAAPYHNGYALEACNDALSAGIPGRYFVKQIYQESGFNPSVVSSGGDIGIAQFQLPTAQGLGINPYDPHSALLGAAQLMGRYYAKYGDYAKALAAYNAGSGSLESAESRCGLAWQSCMPGITQNYINAIMG